MRKQLTGFAAALMIAATAGTACSNSDDTLSNEGNERVNIDVTASEMKLVTGSNDFAFRLFRAARNEKSLILSPISITYALGMLNNGAAGETQQQINSVLGFGTEGADGINAFCRKMLTEAPKLDRLTTVMIANNIYVNRGYELNSQFVQTAQHYYDATPESRDFHDGRTLAVINRWASDHTQGLIPSVLDGGSFNPDAVSYLLNAIYFKGAWAHKFNKSDTKDEDFEGAASKVPMMHQKTSLLYTDNDVCQALQLPYGNSAYRMTVLLPREGKSIDDVLQTLTAEKWDHEYCDRMVSVDADVKLPRFESNTDMGLNAVMSALGMPLAFDADRAEFPNFCSVPTFIGMMKQVARIKLNEEGTEAAAVTVIGMYTTYVGPSEPQQVVFHANRPFLYVISELSTGAIFFIGQYMGK